MQRGRRTYLQLTILPVVLLTSLCAVNARLLKDADDDSYMTSMRGKSVMPVTLASTRTAAARSAATTRTAVLHTWSTLTCVCGVPPGGC